jgi:predicted metal-dependent peptidase
MQAFTQIILHWPFFASILFKRELILDTKIPTACVDARGYIRYNPDWFDTLTVNEVVFVLCHECMHYMYAHCVRRGHRGPVPWNIACDAVINALLTVMGVGTMPKGGVDRPGSDKKSAEQVYDEMEKEPPPPQSGGGDSAPGDQPDGSGGEPGQPEWGIGEDLDESVELDESTAAEIESQVKVDITQAVNSARMAGKLPAELKQFVDELLKVHTPWYNKFYEFFKGLSEDDYSWQALDRRFASQRVYLPWFAGKGMKKVAIINDESGSVSAGEMEEFGGHLNAVLETCKPEVLYFLHVDSRVHSVDEYTPYDYPVKMQRKACGGTDMTKGIDWVVKNHPDVDCLLVLTDGYTPFGEDPGIPTFWAITSDITAPWGETVKLEVGQ